MSTLERFVDHLRAVDHRNTFDSERGVIVVFGEGSDRNAEFTITDQSLGARLSALEESGRLIWPDVDAEVAAFRLLSVHLMEQVDTGNSDHYALDGSGTA